jgi:protein subunit release factor A
MKATLTAKLAQLTRRLADLDHLLGAEDAAADLDNFRRLSREHAEITPVVMLYQEHQAAERDLAAAQEMLADPEVRDFAQSELETAKQRMAALEQSCKRRCCPVTRTTSATSFSKSAPAPAATNRDCSPATCSGCIPGMRSAIAGRSS